MKITRDRGVDPRLADKILVIVTRTVSGEATLAQYDNGREQGYVLTDKESGASVTFSEYRNTDDAVLYLVDWNNSTEGERDAAYQAKEFFPGDKPEAAARRIKNHFALMRRRARSATVREAIHRSRQPIDEPTPYAKALRADRAAAQEREEAK